MLEMTGLCMMSNSCESAWVSVDDDGTATVNLFASVNKSHHLQDMQDGQNTEKKRRKELLGTVARTGPGERFVECIQGKSCGHFFSFLVVIAWVIAGSAAFTYFESDRQADQLREYTAAVQQFQGKYNMSTEDLGAFLSVLGAPELDQYHTLDEAEATEPCKYSMPSSGTYTRQVIQPLLLACSLQVIPWFLTGRLLVCCVCCVCRRLLFPQLVHSVNHIRNHHNGAFSRQYIYVIKILQFTPVLGSIHIYIHIYSPE